VIRPGHPLRWTIPATSLLQTPGTGAIPGSTVYVQLGIAGVLPLRLKTSAGR
jgi:N-acetylneuraminic acid mutarotase